MKINRLKLICLMAENDLQIKDVSELSGVSRATISSIKSGKTCADTTAFKIAAALGVKIEDIIEEV